MHCPGLTERDEELFSARFPTAHITISFGYSVGDFIGGANLACQLIRILTDTRGASIEYQEAILKLSAMQQAFLQVNQLSRNPVIPLATINSASHIVVSGMEIISSFLGRSRGYQKRLSSGHQRHQHSMSDGADSWAKFGWMLSKKDELNQLRDSSIQG
ncbi:hypothetical protein QQZ08_006244 [Neonectria magnoliae]|uniref:Uncharacterized protein n=1 Tax=Neonectria magnoliae TaxID=2732573 RepID=A0ABR1I339_9HYPO